MLTIATMTPGKAGTYYKENYYEEEDHEEFSEWWGEGADALGLSGRIDDAKVFRHVLNGFSPDGKQQLRAEPPKGKEARAGTDLTFSAPKSISIAALVGGDDRLIEAHHRAVDRVLHLIQERYAETRINKLIQSVDNLCVAKFLHDTNRELEPNLHTHCLVMNLAKGADGQWRSATNGNLYHRKMFLGQIYRNELAQEVQKLGYEIEPRTDGLFELKGYTRKQIESFSQRHLQILNYLETQGWEDTTENRIKALFATRKTKQKNVDRGELLELWKAEAEEFGMVHPVSGQPIQINMDFDELISQAIRHNEERTAIFTSEDIELFIVNSPTGKSFTQLESAIKAHPRLIIREGHPARFATEESLEREKMTVAMMQDRRGKLPPIVSIQDIELPEALTPSQENAVHHALNSQDRVLGWVGVAGAGKTFTLKAMVDIVKQQGIDVSGFAPDASSAEVLGDEIGIEVNTVAYQLIRNIEPSTKRKLWIVDEAGKLSAQEAYDLLQKSRLHNAQVLLIGDPKQLTAVNAGAPFKSLVENGLSNTRLKDFLRQKDPIISRAVQLTYYNMGRESIDWLKDHGKVIEVQDVEARAEQISAVYLQLSDEEQKQTLVLSGTHRERQAITAQIRQGLKEKRAIANQDFATEILSNKDMTNEQKQHARFYEVGDVLIPLKHHNSLRRSQRYTITKIEGDNITLNDRITLNTKALKTPLFTEVFIRNQIQIAQGDRLKWSRNNRMLKRFNGREFTIREIDQDKRQVKIQYPSGRLDQFSLDDLNHIDHSIVGTVYSSQGKTSDRVLISFGNDPTVNRESVLVALSRARHDAQIWTPNARELGAMADISNNQVNPSELLKEQGIKLPPPPPPLHIDQKHWLERVEKSAIAPEVAALNVVTLADREVYDRLLSTHLESLGSGQFVTQRMARAMQQYESVAEGGAWAPGGIDATELPTLQPGQTPAVKEFGEFKADNPRIDHQKTLAKGETKYRKYEAPRGVSKGISFPAVPDSIAQKIYDRYGVTPTEKERESGFWACVYWYPEIEIIPVEGKKKAESVISQGYAAIALPSVTGGYRAKENDVELPKRKLHPELEVFATPGRRFLMCFDQDTKQDTIKNVRRDMVRTGELLEEAGCKVSVMKWKPHEGKGIDDLIAKQGVERFNDVLDHASPLQWEADKHYRNEYQKLRGYVMKTHGQGRSPTEVMIDTVIAFHAKDQDIVRILERGKVAQEALKQGRTENAKAHLESVMKNLATLKERLNSQGKQQDPTTDDSDIPLR